MQNKVVQQSNAEGLDFCCLFNIVWKEGKQAAGFFPSPNPPPFFNKIKVEQLKDTAPYSTAPFPT